MSQNNFITAYAGLDVAKATLQLHLRGVGYCLENTKKDHARILRLPFGNELRAEWLAEAEAAAPPGTRIQIVLEATGGYEAALVAARRFASPPANFRCPSGTAEHPCAKLAAMGLAPTHSASLRACGMAAMSAIRHDPILRAFYQRRRAAGKVKMVALSAVMRKLIVLLNRLLANPGFQLRGTAPAPAPAP